MGPLRRSALRAALLVALLQPALAGDAAALLLFTKGEAGSLSSVERMAGPSAAGPIELLSDPVAAGGRFADFTSSVDAGVVRLAATASAATGAQSVGNWLAQVEGSWEDSITFNAPSTIPGLPGVTIVPGTTMGTATLRVTVDGTFDLMRDGSSTATASYGASLGYGILAPFAGRCCGPLWTTFNGSISKSGDANVFFDPGVGGYVRMDTGDPLPTVLELPVSFVFGDSFDVLFQLNARAEIGWEGLASTDILAQANLDQTAVWDGVQDVRVIVDMGGVPTEVPLPDGSWEAVGDAVVYTNPISLPEPGAAALLGLLLAPLLLRRAPGDTRV